jgi:hypothetical protein
MFMSKGVAYPNGSNFNCESSKLAFFWKYKTEVVVGDSNQHPSLLHCYINCWGKMFYNMGPKVH